jgi:hypothetical protein
MVRESKRIPIWDLPTVELLVEFLTKTYSPDAEITVTSDWDEEYGYAETYLAVRYEREETDAEYNRRLKREAREKAKREQAQAKQEKDELAMLKRLKKKYPYAD